MVYVMVAMLCVCANAASVNTETDGGKQPRFLVFSGSDTWPQWAFAHSGVLWSPAGLYNEGFTLKLLLNGGVYRYRSAALNDAKILARQSSLAAMPGWRFKRGGFEVTLFAGLDVQNFKFTPDDPESRLRGRQIGVRTGFELWHEPSPTTMLAADASISSIGAGNSARIAYGWRAFDRLYLGPEVQAFTTDRYHHGRVGIHATAFKTAVREWSGAVGFAADNNHRSSAYIRIGVLARR